jgi:hypothetical protein
MSFTDQVGRVYKSPLGQIVGDFVPYVGDGVVEANASIAAGATQEIDLAVPDETKIQAMVVRAKGGDLTLKTNSSVEPTDEIALVDGVSIIWTSDDPVGNRPFTDAVTKLYAVNLGSAVVSLVMRVLQDSTP